MKHNLLVAYATKYGATAEIARQIGEILGKGGMAVDVLDVDHISDLAQYTAIVLGSAVYAGAWRKEAAAFLTENEVLLRERPVWLFSSGPTGEGDPVTTLKGWRFPEALQLVVDRIRPREVILFQGAIDLNKLSLPEKLVTKGIKAPIGDYRKWHVITAWAEKIATELTK